MESGNKILIKKIKERIKRRGKITFAEFMDMAIYYPDLGYYTSSPDRIGWEGDYYTSADLHPVFGRLIGKQILQMAALSLLNEEKEFFIVEVGGGKGILCNDILNYLKEKEGDFYRRIRYILIDKSPLMKERQERLLKTCHEDRIEWKEKIKDIQTQKGITGCILSNELIDAFPVHIIVIKGGGLKEVYVDLKGENLAEILDEPSTNELSLYLKRLNISLNKGYRTEINLNSIKWIRETGNILRRGFVITIDYGYPANELYAPHRSEGTLLCYYRHKVNSNPYARIGEQDITSHIDFTSIARAGKEEGLEVTGFTDQMHFLMGLRIDEEIKNNMPMDKLARIKSLITPSGSGKTFKILIQHKGTRNLKLDGLRFRPFFQDILS
ncbi:MAG: class I SAM-dependent methyltransferase [Nitrospirota bacterium]